MLIPILAAMLAIGTTTPDTVVTLGMIERDLTGDGVPEVLRLVGVGKTIDSLSVTFSIESSGRVLYTLTFPVSRIIGFDAGRRRLSDEEYQTHLREFGGWFFGPEKFMTPGQFLAKLRENGPSHIAEIPELISRERAYQRAVDSLVSRGHPVDQAKREAPMDWEAPYDTASARAIWDEIQRSGVTIFEFSPGGDSIYAIAWSARDRRFYRIFSCC